MLQPPIWLPRSLALLPATYTFEVDAKGNRLPSFFSSTWDFAAASRPTARWAADPIELARDVSA
jgi:hypothetical protein